MLQKTFLFFLFFPLGDHLNDFLLRVLFINGSDFISYSWKNVSLESVDEISEKKCSQEEKKENEPELMRSEGFVQNFLVTEQITRISNYNIEHEYKKRTYQSQHTPKCPLKYYERQSYILNEQNQNIHDKRPLWILSLIVLVENPVRKYNSQSLKNPDSFGYGDENPLQILSEIELLIFFSYVVNNGFNHASVVLNIFFRKNVSIFESDRHHDETCEQNRVEG